MKKDDIHIGSKMFNRYYCLEFAEAVDWWEHGCYDYFSGIDEQLAARCWGFTDHPTGDTFDGRVRYRRKPPPSAREGKG